MEEGAASEIRFVGLLVDRKGEAGVLSGEAGLEGIFEGEEIGERKVTTYLMGRSKLEGANGWKSSSRSERTERRTSQRGKTECNAA